MTRDEIIRTMMEGPDEDATLAQLDKLDAEHRDATLTAIERLVVERILSAADCPPSTNRFDIYDLDTVVGEDIPGLIMGLFAKKMPGLVPPDPKTLAEAIEYIGLDIPEPERRDKFYRCWAANMAASMVRSMVHFLADDIYKDANANPALRARVPGEIARVRALRAMGLPEDLDVIFEVAEHRYAIIAP
jgi:hypothetical protein